MTGWVELSLLAGLVIGAGAITAMWLRSDESGVPKADDDGFWAGSERSTCGGCGGCSGCGGCGA